MFKFKRALESVLRTHPEDELRALYTPWGETLDPSLVLQEYPRPQMRRSSYTNLNGWWDCAFEDGGMALEDRPATFASRILVPFSPEAPLSGVNRQLMPGETLWYRRVIEIDPLPGKRYLLHFDAVDFSCARYVNGRAAGTHEGGYDPFCFDITDILVDSPDAKDEVEILLVVSDPSETGGQPRGKQRLDRGSIWYTAQSGIWQSVWLEEVPATYIERLELTADPDSRRLLARVRLAGDDATSPALFVVELSDDGEIVASCAGETSEDATGWLELPVPDPHLWSPDDPHLYDVSVHVGDDVVESYCAFRTFGVEPRPDASDGKLTFCCNHEPLFLRGLLDQGYWPDGLLTAPSDEALVFDIELARKLGFNMLRKHAKVEQARWYYHCDRLGMVVWQDMVNGGGDYPDLYTSKLPILFPRVVEKVDDTKKLERFGSQDPHARALWLDGAVKAIEHLRHFPCIATWTVFNEGWGQFFANEMTMRLSTIDDTRPFDQASGWFDQGGGSFVSEHNYFRTLTVPKGRGAHDRRAPVISEFGGAAYQVTENSALDRAYGYETHEDAEAFRASVNGALSQADALERAGLAGYVYTQLSDVEEEVNGLVTYDRRVVKMELGA